MGAMPDENSNGKDKPRGFKAWLKHAFHVEPYDETSLSEEDRDVLERVAQRIHDKKMTPAAIMWAESHRNLNFIGSQLMVMAQPAFEMTHAFINFALGKLGIYIPPEDYPKLQTALEKRYSIEYFIQRLEALGATDYNTGSTETRAEHGEEADPDEESETP